MAIIEVEKLSKAFRIKRRRPGVAGALAALVAAPVETRWAVRELSFTIEAGEIAKMEMTIIKPELEIEIEADEVKTVEGEAELVDISSLGTKTRFFRVEN